MRWLLVTILALVLGAAGLIGALAAGLAQTLGATTPLAGLDPDTAGGLTGSAIAGPGPGGALADIPAGMLRLYSAAASLCPGLSWTVLAAIGSVESDHGRSNLPGVRSGRNGAGAEGPMQFEPSTFAAYAEPVPPGGAYPPSPYDPADAVFAAARMLCADGAGDPAQLGQAIYAYNHSGAYVAQVLSRAAAYGLSGPEGTGAEMADGGPLSSGAGGPSPSSTSSGLVAVDYALSQVGIPYRWGGESPGVGFDCSGLAQAAWAAAGVTLPRVAESQMAAGPAVPTGQPLVPGDLVFFGPPDGPATHVGLVVDPGGVMVDAPHAGSSVRVEPFPVVPGARWGDDVYLGATDPGQ